MRLRIGRFWDGNYSWWGVHLGCWFVGIMRLNFLETQRDTPSPGD
jgi:hypothetical protein